ncbi:MAG: site-specific DNA-methyltransferase [Sinobacteraceae bacterium]|nr:site-specific DNA-methyltransferase [Nevskiaceae bacterium]
MIDVVQFGDWKSSLREMIAAGVRARMCITSPPYFGLRDYGTARWIGGDPHCEHTHSGQVSDSKAAGAIRSGVRPGADTTRCRKCGAIRQDQQVGLEATPEEYVETLVEGFRLVRDLLTDDGTLWVNIGDSYASTGGTPTPQRGEEFANRARGLQAICKSKRVPRGQGRWGGGNVRGSGDIKPKDLIGIPWMLAFALRADGWWWRQDVVWHKVNSMPESVRDRCTRSHEYVLLFSKRAQYYFDNEAISEPLARPNEGRLKNPPRFGGNAKWTGAQQQSRLHSGNVYTGTDTGTRNRRSVWPISTEPLHDEHYAAFPRKIAELPILAGSQPGDVILDPFMGSGTVAEVALLLGRHFVGCELNEENRRIQNKRIASARRIRDAIEFGVSPKVDDSQLGLFDAAPVIAANANPDPEWEGATG